MRSTLARSSLLVAAVVAVAVAAAALAGGGDDDVSGRGWIVEREGSRTFYPRDDDWFGEPNPFGFTVTNPKRRVTVYYYGTFRVEHRDKG